ncbi:Abi family protein [Bifidobacterium longum]|uniref:Abi family protein n=1 Tax=Bifidobacterium longum TaxID=216816 RepID=UPI001928D147|nr:Abi family protein [Bifidobacterium longum]MBL3896592.1 Abi family protein [Bifidobacterium longum subsp. suis]
MSVNSTPHASVHDTANQAGSFSFSQVKPALSFEQQVELMRSRGLAVDDVDEAIRWLSETNYYRIRGYWLTFERDGRFIQGTTLDDIRDTYRLDAGLRLWLWSAIGPIEIKARTSLAYHMGTACGPLSYTDHEYFSDRRAHDKSMQNFRTERERAMRSKVPCVIHNMRKYGCLPIWAAVEIMSMGTMSRLYGNLADSAEYPDGPTVKEAVAKDFAIKPMYLKSWLQHLTYIRNLCGHHSRIYNRTMTSRARMLRADTRHAGLKAFPTIIVLKRIYERVWPEKWPQMTATLDTLIRKYPGVDLVPLGFPEDWRQIIMEQT